MTPRRARCVVEIISLESGPPMVVLVSPRSDGWLDHVLAALARDGCAVVTDVVAPEQLDATRAAMYRARDAILATVGADRLTRAGELGVLRLMLQFDPHFFTLLELPLMLAVVDATVSNSAILHLQNGLLLPPCDEAPPDPDRFQFRFHRDFPRVLNGYLMSINCMLAIDPFTAANGATRVVPGSHQRTSPVDQADLAARSVPVECAAGSMIVFDSTLWHAAGVNRSQADRLAINHQFTRSYVKQQIDYVRALGDAVISSLADRTQQLLGWYTRVVTSLDEYYRPEHERLYRKNQG